MRERAAAAGLTGLVLSTLTACAASAPAPANPVVDAPGHGIVETMAETARSGSDSGPGSGSRPRRGTPSVRAPGAMDPAAFFESYAQTRGFRLGRPNAMRPLADGSALLFLRASARDPRQALYEMDARTGKVRVVLSPDDVARGAEVLTPEEKARRERLRILATGFTDYELTGDGAQVLVSLSGRLVLVDRQRGTWRELPIGDGVAAVDPHLSPDGKSVAYLVGNDVFSLGTAPHDGKAHPVTRGGTANLTHGAAEFVAQEELARTRGFWWSPDARTLLYEEADLKDVERWSLADPGHPERPAESVAYPRPGKKNASVRLGFVAASGAGSTTWVQWNHDAFPYVARVVWAKDGPPLVYVLDRAQKTGLLLAIDVKTGAAREVLREHDDVFLEVDPSVPRMLPGGARALWSSERGGDRRLYTVDLASGALAPVTERALGYRSVIGVDPSGSSVLVTASAEPTESHVYAVALATGAEVTGGSGTSPRKVDQGQSGAGSAGEQARVVALAETGLGMHTSYVLRDTEGRELAKIPSVADLPPFLPQTHLETVGPERMRVAITLPHGFDAKRRYPVVDWAYGGPHLSMVAANGDAYFFQQVLADEVDGVVVSIDAPGTPDRGRDWARAIAGKFYDVPLEGHVTALHALAATHPELDLARVGVFGWSFGGYFASMAVLRHPELYKAGVAGAPVADLMDYDTAYTERYLGVPGPGDTVYPANSVLTYAAHSIDAAHPARPLLLIHGTADDNVYLIHSLKLAGALERARRPFQLYPLVGVTHMPVDPVQSGAMWATVDEFLASHLR